VIRICPWEDLAAMAVFSRLDVHDHIEAELVRGAPCTALGLFAEWRMAQAQGPISLIAVTGPADRPFAVFALGNTGQAGVAEGGLLASDHARHRMALARLAVAIRQRLPAFAVETGINRIEARTWAGHPTASRLLSGMGFRHEADLPAFGRAGDQTFRQFAWTRPAPSAPAPSP
jgi:RimJ/RimL family protein N-acetyltransferase